MTREEILAVYEGGSGDVIELVNCLRATIVKLTMQITVLQEQVEEQSVQIVALQEQVKALEAQLHQNSRNSNKPPSCDTFFRPKSQRPKSDKPSGGQKGHPGHTLKMVDNPDHIIPHRVFTCEECDHSLEETPATDYERRQVFDLPSVKIEVTEHQAEVKTCPYCGYVSKAAFPEEVREHVQYGPRLKATVAYLTNYQLLPLERQAQLFADLFDHSLSQATLINANQAAYNLLEPAEEEIKQQLIASPVLHCDETGLYVDGKRQWLHVVSTDKMTCYAAHHKRGQEATKEMGILPDFQGTAVHDFWKPYYQYECDHALCNAHHLRELTGIAEQDKKQWPQEMKDLLLGIKQTVDETKTKATALNPVQIQSFEERYNQIIAKGLTEEPSPTPEYKAGKRGRHKQSKAKNLLDRLREHHREVLAFMYDFRVPFDNNQAERDIRMTKVQQKISGTFRTTQGADIFCRLRGYISTVKKHGLSVIDALQGVFGGNPFIPTRADPQ